MSHHSSFESEALPHAHALYALALRFTRSPSDAEDLVQDVLLKAYQNFDTYQAGTNCRAWLFRILENTFINRYRHKMRENAYIESVKSEPFSEAAGQPERMPGANDADFSDCDYFNSFPDEVVHALKSVSKDFRSIIILADLQELTYREIAEKLHIPIGTVMSRLARARQSLRRVLGDYARTLGYAS